MVQDSHHAGLLRARDGGEQRVTPPCAFLRPGLRLRRAAALPPAAGPPDHRQRAGDAAVVASSVAVTQVVSTHAQLVRSRQNAGALAPRRRYARELVHVGRDTGRLRRAGTDVRRRIRDHTGGAHCLREPRSVSGHGSGFWGRLRRQRGVRMDLLLPSR